MTDHRTHDDEHDDDDAFAERIAAPLRVPERARDDFEDSLIGAIRADTRLRRVIPRRTRPMSPAWWTSPSVRLSPLASLALVAGIAAIAVVGARRTFTPASSRSATAPAPAVVATAPVRDTITFVRFVFVGHAKSVALVGDFNGWSGQTTKLDRTTSGTWTASVPLTNGRHEYAFIIDGERWVADPLAPSSSDEFDTNSSVINVGT